MEPWRSARRFFSPRRVFHPAPRCGRLFWMWTDSRAIREGRYQEKVELCRLFGPTAGDVFYLWQHVAQHRLSLYHPQRSPPGWLISGTANTLPRWTAHMNIWLFFCFCFFVYLWIFKEVFFVFFNIEILNSITTLGLIHDLLLWYIAVIPGNVYIIMY